MLNAISNPGDFLSANNSRGKTRSVKNILDSFPAYKRLSEVTTDAADVREARRREEGRLPNQHS